MSKLNLLLCLVFYLPVAWSEPALYKEIKLTAFDHLLVIGNVDVSVIKSDVYKAELFLREQTKSSVKVGTEKSKQGVRLVIKTELDNQFSEVEPISAAKVNVYLPSIEGVDLQSVSTFKMGDFSLKKLRLWASGNSLLFLKNMRVEQLYFNVFGKVSVEGSKLTLNSGQVIQNNQSRVLFSNVNANKLVLNGKKNSRFKAVNIQGEYLNIQLNNSAKLSITHGQFISAQLTARNKANLNVAKAKFKSIRLNAYNQAKVALGKAELLEVTAKNSVVLNYFPAEYMQLNKQNNAQLKPYSPLIGKQQ